MHLLIEFLGLDLGDTSPEALAAAVARLIEGGVELPDGRLYTNDVRVHVVDHNDEFPAPVPGGPGTGNSPSLRSVA